MPTQDAGDELILAIPPEPGVIAIARIFAAASCRHIGMDEDRIDDVKVAASEAVTNAVKAHLAGNVTGPIRLVVRTRSKVLEVTDAGAGFEPPARDPVGTPPGGLYEGSLGLSLIQALFPDVQIERNHDRGMTIRFSLDASVSSRPAG
jgi:serine/threonine-protein kinase RsbW